ncbi:hypothetical protein [Streptomyces sp. NPDC060187]|uniref:hypothetical protein n=1 Tax=Streptomyces sp. NPDC060187 TaxID=3347067 RepID=UPI003656B9D1
MNDSTMYDALLEAAKVRGATVGWPRRRPDRVLATRPFLAPIGAGLRRRGIQATIPGRPDQVANRNDAAPVAAGHRDCDPLRQLAVRYRSGLHLASLTSWLHDTTG